MSEIIRRSRIVAAVSSHAEAAMSLEILNAVAPILTVVIVGATAIAALVQLKHLRAGNQITAMLAIGEELSGKTFSDATDLVRDKLGEAIEDPKFREYEVALSLDQTAPDVDRSYVEVRRASLVVGNGYEELGILVKRGIIDRDMFLDRYCWVISGAWKRLEPVTALGRAAMENDWAWENFEYLAVLAEDWMAKHGAGTYPHGMRRMKLSNRWPLPASAAASSR
jgi:heme/copper-type cytochrome/quinol oxidase subunit 2